MIELKMQVSDFDYSETLENFLPDIMILLQESENLNPLIRMACSAPPEVAKSVAKTVLAAMSQSQKEALTAKFINRNIDKICKNLNAAAARNGIILRLENGEAIAK